jgi:hypothetical protein
LPSLKSSKGYSQTLSKEGIFDSDPLKSSLWGATKVFLPYCSSDGWVGDAPASEKTWGYHFRGQRIIRSALNDLITKNIVHSASKMVFGGGSAGARGMMNNVDSLVNLLPSGATTLGAFLDSPYTIDIAPYNYGFVGFQNETMEIYNRYNVTAIIPADCAAVYTELSGDGWKCLFGQYRMPFIRTRYVLVASQYDSYQLSFNTGTEPIAGHYGRPEVVAYAGAWSAQTYSALLSLADMRNHLKYRSHGGNFYHSWACYNHDVSETSRYYTLTSVNTTLRDAVKMLQDSEVAQLWVEQCEGLFCGSGCEETEI